MEDAYLQLAMSRENEKEFARQLLMAYSTWATIPTKEAGQFASRSSDMIDILHKTYFPYAKQAESNKDRDAQQLQLVEKFFNAFDMGDLVPQKPNQPDKALIEAGRRESIWEKMAKTKKE